VSVARAASGRRGIFLAFGLMAALGSVGTVRAEDARSADDARSAEDARSAADARSRENAYLDALQGDWDMTGTLLGKPVKYHARGERVLQGGFLRLHMIDATAAPTYEADLFLGYDAHADDYIGHWLDRFGAAGARVVASGKRTADTLVIEFPYADSAFRDTFVHDPKSRTWSLRIESQGPGGGWSDFAVYTLVRATGKSAH
jgi:hypothetical protein